MASNAEPTIVDESQPENVSLVLLVEGQRVASARADGDVLGLLKAQLGVSRAEVRADLEAALLQLHRDALDRVTIEGLRENPVGSGRYVAKYIERDFRTVTEGLVWYELERGDTGPESASWVVRNKLRYAVHLLLAGNDPAVKKLLEAVR
jgi:hypothetical protein